MALGTGGADCVKGLLAVVTRLLATLHGWQWHTGIGFGCFDVFVAGETRATRGPNSVDARVGLVVKFPSDRERVAIAPRNDLLSSTLGVAAIARLFDAWCDSASVATRAQSVSCGKIALRWCARAKAAVTTLALLAGFGAWANVLAVRIVRRKLGEPCRWWNVATRRALFFEGHVAGEADFALFLL